MAAAQGQPTAPNDEDPDTVMTQIFNWVGFNDDGQIANLLEDIPLLADMGEMTEDDVDSMSHAYSRRTQNEGRIIFNVRRTNRLKGVIHWIMDHYRISEEPDIFKHDEESFRFAISRSHERARIRVSEFKNSSELLKDASPGKLKSERVWETWTKKISNYLSMIPGVLQVPLVYVIRDEETPTSGESYDSFTEQAIACAPLRGPRFEADARKVHQLILSCVEGESSEAWIKPIKRYLNGRRDWIALKKHYEGAGNTTRRIAEADRLRDTLFYKSERALPFATFLDRLQRWFTISEHEEEKLSENQKVRYLLEKTQHQALQEHCKIIKIQNAREDQSFIDFTEAANILSAEVATLPEYTAKGNNRNASAISKGSKIYDQDGKIIVGLIEGWFNLDPEEKALVAAERKKRGVVFLPGKNGQAGKVASRKTSNSHSKSRTSSLQSTVDRQKNEMKDMKEQMEKQSRKIASLKKDDSDSEPEADAGNEFGGKRAKKAKKSNRD